MTMISVHDFFLTGCFFGRTGEEPTLAGLDREVGLRSDQKRGGRRISTTLRPQWEILLKMSCQRYSIMKRGKRHHVFSCKIF